MTYDTLRYIFIGGAIFCGIMLLVTVVLFIVLNIPRVMGDLTGRTAKKAIEKIRNQNELSGDKTYKSSHVNKERGKLTDKISPSGNIINRNSDSFGGAMATSKIATQGLGPDAAANETSVLGEETSLLGEETSLLSEETSLLGEETSVLNEGNVTEVLGTPESDNTEVLSQPGAFKVEYEITFIHSDEVIA